MFLAVGDQQVNDQRIVVMFRRLVYLSKVSRQRLLGLDTI
jgi:hypothetical protein